MFKTECTWRCPNQLGEPVPLSDDPRLLYSTLHSTSACVLPSPAKIAILELNMLIKPSLNIPTRSQVEIQPMVEGEWVTVLKSNGLIPLKGI